MTVEHQRGPIVIDTDVFGAELVAGSRLAVVYEPIVVGRPAFVSFHTSAELQYGAFRRNWGPLRMLQLAARINQATVVYPGPELVLVYAELGTDCERNGHALGHKHHDADRWTAATAIRLGVPLVSDDRIFLGVPGLTLETVASP